MMKADKDFKVVDISTFSEEDLTDAFVFPSQQSLTDEEKGSDEEFWQKRRKQFENRSPKRKMYSKLLQLKFQIEDYVGSNQYKEALSFGYFLNEYVSRQEKQGKQFACEVNVKPAVLSQYLNDHRKPTDQFVIRLELHSNGMIPALTWFKLLQKDKEHKITTDVRIRQEEGKHIKNRLEFAY